MFFQEAQKSFCTQCFLVEWMKGRKEGKLSYSHIKNTVYQKNLPLPLYLCIQQTRVSTTHM